MTKRKIRVALVFGGRSSEHDVSIASIRNILKFINTEKYELSLIQIDREGRWYFQKFLLEQGVLEIHFSQRKAIALVPTRVSQAPLEAWAHADPLFHDLERSMEEPPSVPQKPDILFPVLHGANGEDGAIQGLSQILGIPFVGCGVLSSAIGMDKEVTKRLLKEAKIPVAPFVTLHRRDLPFSRAVALFERELKEWGMPLFVKPSGQGSSVGVSKVTSYEELEVAVEKAFSYDHKVLIEKAVLGRELECAILGNETPRASLPCEIFTNELFHTYASKYTEEGSRCVIPAELSDEQRHKVQQLSLATYETLGCEGMARVDLFLDEEGKILINEINTLPGLTPYSAYYKMWEKSGLSFSELLDELIELGLKRAERDQLLTRLETQTVEIIS